MRCNKLVFRGHKARTCHVFWVLALDMAKPRYKYQTLYRENERWEGAEGRLN
jgi:hypothetical protein